MLPSSGLAVVVSGAQMSGTFVSGGAHWRAVKTDDCFQILPGRSVLVGFAIVGMCTFAACAIWIPAAGFGVADTALFLCAGGLALAVVGVALYWDYCRGAYLIVDRRLNQMSLPRHAVSICLTCPMNFRIEHQVPCKVYDGIGVASELWLDVDCEASKASYIVVASYNMEPIEQIATQLREVTGVTIAPYGARF